MVKADASSKNHAGDKNMEDVRDERREAVRAKNLEATGPKASEQKNAVRPQARGNRAQIERCNDTMHEASGVS